MWHEKREEKLKWESGRKIFEDIKSQIFTLYARRNDWGWRHRDSEAGNGCLATLALRRMVYRTNFQTLLLSLFVRLLYARGLERNKRSLTHAPGHAREADNT